MTGSIGDRSSPRASAGEAEPLGRAHIRVVALCALVALFDGMDLQSIGLAAPSMGAALQIAPRAFGPVFSAALAGLAIGALSLGALADRVGRKRVLIGATACFAVFTLCTAATRGLGDLLVYRFLTGVGLGGAMPSFISLASEYVPRRMRATMVSLMWAGFPVGGVVGGLLASWLIPAAGWRALFLAGGVPPLLLAVLLVSALPESIAFLARYDTPAGRGRGRDLFARGLAMPTLLLWVAFFFAFLILVTNSAWSPTLLGAVGMPIDRSALAMAAFNFGSVIGTGAGGWLLARLGTLALLPATFALSALAYALVGAAAPAAASVSSLQGAFGLCVGCASSILIALAALVYPTAIRATGVGCAMAAGRLGSFCGPLLVGFLVGQGWSAAGVFPALGASVLIGALASLLLGLRERGAGSMAERQIEPARPMPRGG